MKAATISVNNSGEPGRKHIPLEHRAIKTDSMRLLTLSNYVGTR